MKSLRPLTIDSAPEAAKKGLRTTHEKFGFIPNVIGTLAHAPALLNGYLALDAAWQTASLTAKERELVLLTASVDNKCAYCVAAHTSLLKSLKVDKKTIDAIKAEKPLSNEKQDSLTKLTRELVSKQGFVAESTKERFIATGYDEVALMEVLAGIALKTMSNYLDHLNPIPIDGAFEAEGDANYQPTNQRRKL